MKPFPARAVPLALAVAALALLDPAVARADERDVEALERRIEELERRLAEMQARSAGGAGSELEARVAELEKLTKKDKDGLFAYWKTGLRLDSADRAFRLQIGGRLMTDFTWWSGDRDTEAVVGSTLDSGAEFRRAHLFLAGTIHRNTQYKFQYAFANGGSLDDAYIAFTDLLPGTRVQVGHHFVPFGMEEQTSSKYITFAERGVQTVFSPGRQTGVSLGGSALAGDLNWRVMGFYFTTDAFGNHRNGTKGETNLAGRVALRPWVADAGDAYLHVGGSFGFLRPNGDVVRWRRRPQVHIAPRFVDTGSLAAREVTVHDVEFAAVSGPFHLMAEVAGARVNRAASPAAPGAPTSNVGFDAFVVQAGAFLTGEQRPYKNGNFGRVVPKSNHGEEDGLGAVEVAARYAHVDLDDRDVRGGKLGIWSLGLNWYLNPQTVIKCDYERIDPDRKDATLRRADGVHAFTVRFQIDF